MTDRDDVVDPRYDPAFQRGYVPVVGPLAEPIAEPAAEQVAETVGETAAETGVETLVPAAAPTRGTRTLPVVALGALSILLVVIGVLLSGPLAVSASAPVGAEPATRTIALLLANLPGALLTAGALGVVATCGAAALTERRARRALVVGAVAAAAFLLAGVIVAQIEANLAAEISGLFGIASANDSTVLEQRLHDMLAQQALLLAVLPRLLTAGFAAAIADLALVAVLLGRAEARAR